MQAVSTMKVPRNPNTSTKSKMLTAIRSLATALLFFLALTGSAFGQGTVEVTGLTMGPIPFRALVATNDTEQSKLNDIKSSVNNSLEKVNHLMSTYLEDSDVSKFNRSESTDWISVEAETAEVVLKALEISKLTDGAFDPTVGPAVNAWKFGPDKSDRTNIPDDKKITELKSVVGYEAIEVRSDPPAIRKQNPAAKIDLSAIAKGYAVDVVGKSLEALGYENYMVVVGGEVITRGERAEGGPWNIAVEKPEKSGPTARTLDRTHRIVKLSDRAIATSGDYRNFYDVDGKRYSHTIDPQTCVPVDHNMAIASVVADDCMTADALATAVMVMGQEKGEALCQKLGYPLLTVLRSDSADGLPHITNSSADFPLAEKEDDATTDTEEASSSILPVFLATFVIFCLMVLGMAVGAIFNNKPVTGSCGGIANMTNEDGDSVCGICSKPTTDCTEPVEA